MRKGTALAVGATGLTGGNLANYLVANGWSVYGLSRSGSEQQVVIPVAADLLNKETDIKSSIKATAIPQKARGDSRLRNDGDRLCHLVAV